MNTQRLANQRERESCTHAKSTVANQSSSSSITTGSAIRPIAFAAVSKTLQRAAQERPAHDTGAGAQKADTRRCVCQGGMGLIERLCEEEYGFDHGVARLSTTLESMCSCARL
jgi:hypothetical protein